MDTDRAAELVTMSTQGIRRNKLHKEGAILFQATFDHRHAAVRGADSDYPLPKDQDVLIGDLLFSHKHSALNSRHAKARIGGLVIAVSPFLPERTDEGIVPQGVRHAGIAVTTFSHKVNRPEERIVVQCGGLATIDVDEAVCVGEMLVCKAPTNQKNSKKKRGRASAVGCTFDKTKRAGSYQPILGRCLTNGRAGGTVDVILSANAPGLLWF